MNRLARTVLIPLVAWGACGLESLHRGAGAQEREGGRRAESDRRRRPAERDSDRPAAEADRGRGRADAREGDANILRGFKPQTPREAALARVIMQLQRELTLLRRQVQARGDLAPDQVEGAVAASGRA